MKPSARKIIFFLFLFTVQQTMLLSQNMLPPFRSSDAHHWADSVMKRMTYEEKIGQLLMPAAVSDTTAQPDSVLEWITKYHIGGLMFLKGSPLRQAELTNRYQDSSKIPLLISIDAEWGLNMRLDSTIRFPRQMTLGAMKNDSLIYTMAAEIARQCRRLGIHINFAPVVDINNNAANPVINSRAFGENKNDVARKGLLYMNGLQDNRVLACAKHFPGHGNTDTDSHLELPVINQSAAEIDSVELFPFRHLINKGLGSVMAAHLFIPALDTAQGQASTLSNSIVTGLLKDRLDFSGLIFTDALNMKGVSNFFSPGEIELKALLAGNDMLLHSGNIPLVAGRIHFAIQNCEIEQDDIDRKVRKILAVKYWAGLNNYRPAAPDNLISNLNSENGKYLSYRLYKEAITVLKNQDRTLPVWELHKNTIASVVVNDSLGNFFQQTLDKYAAVDKFRMDKEIPDAAFATLRDSLLRFSTVILSIHNTSTKASLDFGISVQTNKMIAALSGKTKLIVCLFGNSYCISKIQAAASADAFIISYEDTSYPVWITAQLIFGAGGADGKLPVTPLPDYLRGSGIDFEDENLRIRFGFPQEENLSPVVLTQIDSIVHEAISEKAMPGCQVLAAKNGKVIFEKSYGYKTYDCTEVVRNDDLFDIASVTKIAATALATMKLYEEGKIDLNKKASRYLPALRKYDKRDITLIDMLTHQSGLKAWLPFYEKTLASGKPYNHIYRSERSDDFPHRVADSLFIKKDYADVILKEIYESQMGEKGKYVYSDLGLLIMQQVIEKITGKKLDKYVEENFYRPLGLHNITYNPMEKNIPPGKIVPTENDTVFRHQLIRGTVHDPSAAMLGGVAGNAGLFSDASSLAVIMQLLLNGGEYGGRKYFKRQTIEYFTRQQFPGTANRRGVIFDKPEVNDAANGPTCEEASPKTFGHTGFTGTCAWADPEHKLIFILLSNRVYPDAGNRKLLEHNIRTRMMQVIYKAEINLEDNK